MSADDFLTLLAHSEPVEAFRVRHLLDEADLSCAEGKDRALNTVRPFIERTTRMEDGYPLRDYLLWLAAERVGVDEWTLRSWWGWPGLAETDGVAA